MSTQIVDTNTFFFFFLEKKVAVVSTVTTWESWEHNHKQKAEMEEFIKHSKISNFYLSATVYLFPQKLK